MTYGLPGMDAHGVEVLHVAYYHAVVLGVPHHLVLELLPSQDRLLDEDLVDARVDETLANYVMSSSSL
jgi:hypothetical protein